MSLRDRNVSLWLMDNRDSFALATGVRTLERLAKKALNSGDSDLWSDLHHSRAVLAVRRVELQREIAEACAPWFDSSAFAAPPPLYWPLVCNFDDMLGPEAFRRKTA